MKINVVKVGGAVVENSSTLESFLASFASLDGAKILVHGGGRSATAIASRLGIETTMVEGRRITGKEMLDVVTMVYGGLVNKNIVSALQRMGVNALGLTGADLGCIKAEKRKPVEIGDSMVDFGCVGDVTSVNAPAFMKLLSDGAVPVLAPLSFDPACGLLNTNADTIASSTACSLAGENEVVLTYCFEKAGVLADPEDESSVIKEICPSSYEGLKAEGIVAGGMIPKLDNAFKALSEGVSKVVITSASVLDGGTSVIGQ